MHSEIAVQLAIYRYIIISGLKLHWGEKTHYYLEDDNHKEHFKAVFHKCILFTQPLVAASMLQSLSLELG